MFLPTSRLLTRVVGVAGALALIVGSAVPAVADTGSLALQKTIEQHMRDFPGAIQVSDNAIAYERGAVVLVFPNHGENVAPDGLGPNVRTDAARSLGLQMDPQATAYRRGCPYSTITNADWYCFYTDHMWQGRRLQFKDSNYGYPSNWGFDNQTTSWVNTNSTFEIWAYDSYCNSLLWREPTGISESSNVGTTRNDRMGYWTKYSSDCN